MRVIFRKAPVQYWSFMFLDMSKQHHSAALCVHHPAVWKGVALEECCSHSHMVRGLDQEHSVHIMFHPCEVLPRSQLEHSCADLPERMSCSVFLDGVFYVTSCPAVPASHSGRHAWPICSPSNTAERKSSLEHNISVGIRISQPVPTVFKKMFGSWCKPP